MKNNSTGGQALPAVNHQDVDARAEPVPTSEARALGLDRTAAEIRLGGQAPLTTSHISTPVLVRFVEGGEMVEVRIPTGRHEKRRPVFEPAADTPAVGDRPEGYEVRWERKKRGPIRDFSRGSRGRLMRRLASADKDKVMLAPLFITLTYPEEWPADAREWKRHLEAFRSRWERKYGRCASIWKMEFQRRGAPHFHLAVFVGELVRRSWVARAWYEIVGSGDIKHLLRGAHVRRVRTWRGMKSYVSKYMGKEQEAGLRPAQIGRCWGVWHWKLIAGVIQEAMLTAAEGFRLRRWLLKLLCKRGLKRHVTFRFAGCWCFLSADEVRRLLACLLAGGGGGDDRGPGGDSGAGGDGELVGDIGYGLGPLFGGIF
jgi:hypothetical protein